MLNQKSAILTTKKLEIFYSPFFPPSENHMSAKTSLVALANHRLILSHLNTPTVSLLQPSLYVMTAIRFMPVIQPLARLQLLALKRKYLTSLLNRLHPRRP